MFIVFPTQSVARNESDTMMIHDFLLWSNKDDLEQGGAKKKRTDNNSILWKKLLRFIRMDYLTLDC